MKYPIHPACAAWPRMSDAELHELANSIMARGQLHPIYLTNDGEIISGHMRYLACEMAGVEPVVETYKGNDLVGLTIAENKNRRHMTANELMLMIATLREKFDPSHGGDRRSKAFHKVSSERRSLETSETEKNAGISDRMIQYAADINRHAEPNVIEMVKKGEVGIVNASLYARHTNREAQRTADTLTVKKRGGKLRTPNAPAKKNTPETLPSVLAQLLVCAKELQDLSTKNDMTLSFTAFRFAVAHLLKALKVLQDLVADEIDTGKTKGKHRTPLRSVS
jgi:ParB-like chromosome segregation protein Spo0J